MRGRGMRAGVGEVEPDCALSCSENALRELAIMLSAACAAAATASNSSRSSFTNATPRESSETRVSTAKDFGWLFYTRLYVRGAVTKPEGGSGRKIAYRFVSPRHPSTTDSSTLVWGNVWCKLP